MANLFTDSIKYSTMKPYRWSWLLVLALALGNAQAANRLAGHPSPYLALHGEDPVDWRPWQADVFADAKRDNRLVFVSIGYFSCHWCHVMQRESYQDDAIAELLNRDYISVKVDRELEPDLDQRLIDFVEKIRGSAGWPLNVFLTPDGYPITGFTYLPREDFSSVLRQLDKEWQKNHESLGQSAREFFNEQMQEWSNEAYVAPQIPADKLVNAFVSQAMLAADELLGGFGNTSKFPNVPQLDTLLEIVTRNPGLDPDVADFIELTLDSMASKNLSDHVNGGFFRYTTDPDWQTPHFEKMLYDNAQLAVLYFKAHRQWPEQGYAEQAVRTLEFVETALKHPEGGYMSSLSAVDSDDKEGGGYFWNRELLSRLLSDQDFAYLKEIWNIEIEAGEFLARPLIGAGATGDPARNRNIMRKLQSRADARMPVDDKRLASWNAMLLEALVLAADVDEAYARRAREQFAAMRKIFFVDGKLVRFAGNADLAEAVLEDFAQVAQSFLRYGTRFDDSEARRLAANLTEDAHKRFLKDQRWRQKAQPLIPVAQGKWIIPDLVFYSPMTLWIRVALEAPGLQTEVRESARQMLTRATRDMLDTPYFYGSFIMLRSDKAG